ncbi:MAG: hypothetical protein IT323_08105 [Anaerolineae bacterium]|nr:hypothetical protein [Anaerolineae bacterium]
MAQRQRGAQRAAGLLILALAVLASACTGTATPDATQPPGGGIFEWDPTPGAVLVRVDRLIENEPAYERQNRVPPCTLFGDGRVVWTNATPPNGEEVLEAYVGEGAIRAFLEFIVRDQQFYAVPDYAAQELPPAGDAALTSITLAVNRDVHTVRSYREWPNNVYIAILNRCRALSDSPALLVPTGAWLSATETARNSDIAEVYWPPAGPFRMADLAASGEARWVEGPALAQFWTYQRRTLGQVNWLEDDKAYRVVIQAPGVSRDSPPAPPSDATATSAP